MDQREERIGVNRLRSQGCGTSRAKLKISLATVAYGAYRQKPATETP